MNEHRQLFVALVLVTIACGYLLRLGLRSWMQRGGCSRGCGGCGSNVHPGVPLNISLPPSSSAASTPPPATNTNSGDGKQRE